MTRETMSEIFERSPQEAVEEAFTRYRKRVPWGPDAINAWQWTTGIDGTGYGSYRIIKREELNSRTFEIELCDYDIGIHWTDMLFDPRGCKHIPKEKANV